MEGGWLAKSRHQRYSRHTRSQMGRDVARLRAALEGVRHQRTEGTTEGTKEGKGGGLLARWPMGRSGRGSARWLVRKVKWLAGMRALYLAGSATRLGITSHTNAAATIQSAATSSIVVCSPAVYAAW